MVFSYFGKMFGPLDFQESSNREDNCTEVTCLLCADKYNLNCNLPHFLKHLFEAHHLVIEDAQNVDNLKGYIEYWKAQFQKHEMEQIVPSIAVLFNDNKYYLLSDLLKEDKDIRHKLKLDSMLQVQEFERNDSSYQRQCLFCKFAFEGKRSDYLAHLMENHNLRLGNPQNLVYVDEFINKVNEQLDKLICLYCEKTFPDRAILKEHMRKKQHKRVNPSNRMYDKFYAVNYLNADKDWYNKPEITVGEVENSDEQYEDWNEGDAAIVCLFCTVKENEIHTLCNHMLAKHKFNFYEEIKALDFYEKVKFVNYVRRQIHRLSCICCDSSYEDAVSLNAHMEQEEHFRVPDFNIFNQPEFYFPTYENDSLLLFLEEIEDE